AGSDQPVEKRNEGEDLQDPYESFLPGRLKRRQRRLWRHAVIEAEYDLPSKGNDRVGSQEADDSEQALLEESRGGFADLLCLGRQSWHRLRKYQRYQEDVNRIHTGQDEAGNECALIHVTY